MWLNFSLDIRNTDSISGASERFANDMVNSASMSVSVRNPRSIIDAPQDRTNDTAKPFEALHVDIFQRLEHGARHRQSLVRRKQRLFFRVDTDAHSHLFEHARPAANNVLVSQRQRIEAADVYGVPSAQYLSHRGASRF